jgi:hypothetical protein
MQLHPVNLAYRYRLCDEEAAQVITATVEEIHRQQALLVGSMMMNFHLCTSCYDM